MNSLSSVAEFPALPNPTIQQLRQQLRDQFPLAHRGAAIPEHAPAITPVFPDAACFPKGGISEISPVGSASGMGLILASLLEQESAPGSIPELALIDGRDQFDPRSFAPHLCARLLWVRCLSPEQSLKAADLLLRDGNLPRVVLDLLGYSSREIATIRAGAWHRLKQWIESSASTLIALTPRPMVPCTAARFGLRSRIDLEHLNQSRHDLIGQLQVASPPYRRMLR